MANIPVAIPLAEMGVDERQRAEALARRYHAEFVDLKHFKIHHELFKSVPVDMMFRYNFVPLEQEEGRLAIVGAMYDVVTGEIEFLTDAARCRERILDAV